MRNQSSGIPMKRTVWALLTLAIMFSGVCALYPTSPIHIGWIGTLSASVSGLAATISSYQTEEKVDTRGGPVYKAKSPITFLLNYLLVCLFLTAIAGVSILGCLGREV